MLVSDLGLAPQEEYIVAIAYEIRKQIMLHCCHKVQHFVSIYENYVAKENEFSNFETIDEKQVPSKILYAASLSNEDPALRTLIHESSVT